MKPYLYSLIAAAAACGLAQAQSTAYTTPVGYVSVGSPIGNAVSPSTDVIISVPLDRPTVYAGAVDSITGANVITLQGSPGFTVDQFTTQPNVVRITSGTKNGFYALITANTANSLTVSLPPGQDLTSVAGSDKISISLAWTAKAFFSSAVLPPDCELYQFSGVAPGTNPSADFTYVWDGVDWIDGGSGNPVDPVLYGGESFILRNISATTPIPSIVVSGQVPVSRATNILANYGAGQQDLPLALFAPTDQTLAQTGLIALAQPDDEIYFFSNTAAGFNKSASVSLVFDGTDFLDAGSGSPVDPNTFMFKAGDGFTYRRANGSPTVSHNFSPNYLGSL